MLSKAFFNRAADEVAKDLLGKVLRVAFQGYWLSAQIIETEAYFIDEKGSHASLGFTQKRKALFMPPGTIYMYYAHGGDSLNISCQGEGNAVLIKSGIPYLDGKMNEQAFQIMQQLNPLTNGLRRPWGKLCKGQTLLCRALGLKVPEWDQQQFDPERFFVEDVSDHPEKIVQAKRLGIPQGRDEHLLYRFIDYDRVKYCTSNPITKKRSIENKDYKIL